MSPTPTSSDNPSAPISEVEQEIAERWPEAVELARSMRAVFGDEVRLMFAWNTAGQQLKRRGWTVFETTKALIRSSTRNK